MLSTVENHRQQASGGGGGTDRDVTVRVRERQWMYLGPILAAPAAHVCVTLYRDAKTPRQKQALLGLGIIGSTVASVGVRLALMAHAGYPGREDASSLAKRELLVTSEEAKAIRNPSATEIIKEAIRGFG